MKRKKKKLSWVQSCLVLCRFYVYIATYFCSFHRFISILSRFFNFRPPPPPPPFISTPPFIKFWKFFRPPLFILTPPFIRHLRVVNENSERLIERFIEVLAEKQEAIVAGVLEQHPYPSDFQILFRRQKLLGTWLNLCCLVQVNGL